MFIDDDMQVTGDVVVNGALEATGQVDFTNIAGWMEGGYKTQSLSPGGSWGLQTSNATVRRIANFVFLSGRFVNDTATTNNPGSVVTFVGADFQPNQFKYLVCPAETLGVYTGQARIVVESGGNIKLAPAGGGNANDVNAGQAISLDGVCYMITD
jgi:hypothetical protein